MIKKNDYSVMSYNKYEPVFCEGKEINCICILK